MRSLVLTAEFGENSAPCSRRHQHVGDIGRLRRIQSWMVDAPHRTYGQRQQRSRAEHGTVDPPLRDRKATDVGGVGH